ncbi:rho guanine nucleotide exchange factor 28 [Neosynchiropus ocellatus]
METDRRKVPLYGQVEAHVMLEGDVPSEAEFFVVLRGSNLFHVTGARREDELQLRFTVPGHDLPEVVCVSSYFLSERQAQLCGVQTSLEYVKDLAYEVAERLSANRSRLLPGSYLDALKRLSVGGADEHLESEERDSGVDMATLKMMDEKVTFAVANMDYPPWWSDVHAKDNDAAEDILHKDSLLHLAVRLDLLNLCRFLLHQPGGQRSLALADQEGLVLPQQDGQRDILWELTPGAGRVPGVWCVWSDHYRILRFCPTTQSSTLTVKRGCDVPYQEDILLFRDKLSDRRVIEQMNNLTVVREAGKEGEEPTEEAVIDNVFEEQLILSLDDVDDDEEEEEEPTSLCVIEDRIQFSQHASGSPVSMMDGISPVDDGDIKLSIGGVTQGSSGTDGGFWETEEVTFSAHSTPPGSPTDVADSSLCALAFVEPANPREDPPLDTCDISSVSLEVDSGDDLSPKPLDPSDAHKVESSQALTCTRSLSAYSPQKHVSPDDQGIRLRSYSSSKISLRPTRLLRDNQVTDRNPDAALHGVSHGRSLLQALSLSKSLSLLHPGKQKHSTEVSHEKRDVSFRKRTQSADEEENEELAESLHHLTLSEFLKEIEEEELDKYSVPAKVESDKYKVIRTFSFLKSRMSSTRSKTKVKMKDRDSKERPNGHRFSAGACLGPTVCVVCDRPATGRELLHCPTCCAIVHKGCRDAVPPCLKKLQDKYSVTSVKNRTASLPQNFTVRESSPQTSVSSCPPVCSQKDSTPSSPVTGSFPFIDGRPGDSSETDSWRLTGQQEDILLVSATSTDSPYDGADAHVYGDILVDAADFEAESWSLAVDHKFCKKQDKKAVKRQDVIYELMQTELHHLQTLHIMAEVFRRGMKEEVQLDTAAVERVFPCLDQLLVLHHDFFSALKERRLNSAEPQDLRNYLIQRIGDILLQQFSEESGEKIKQVYGDFCSHHNEAVSFFKDLQQHNKRFQVFIKQQGNNSLVKRREIPECILLVTQRITKYPVLLERILQYTQEDTPEYRDISKSLAQVRDVIAAVDLRVSKYEQRQRLLEVSSRMENRSAAKLKNGHTFRKQDMMDRTLKHQGVLLWKTATGRLKDVLALLLTDVLVLLQEKDQKFTFAAVDQKPPVIPLQKLIVREVANEERGMFLISASTAGPEMYEVHTSSKEERNIWMRLIREAVESCPEEEEESTSESEEEKRVAEARVQKIHKLQESLMSTDQQICSSLEEKLHIYAELSTMNGRTAETPPEPRLLVQPNAEEPPQAVALLAAALQEAENLKAAISSRIPEFPGDQTTILDTCSDLEIHVEDRETAALPDLDLKVSRSVHSLTQLLFSLQAAVTIQDSCYEVQRLLLQDSGRPSPRAHQQSARAGLLQEQEKQRNQEKQKEEAASAQRLQERLRQERERWDRECQARESQQGEQESLLEEREKRCHLEAGRLRREREELEEQLREYQLSLERLREGQRSVERAREQLEGQQKLIQTFRPAVVPHMVIPLDRQQDSVLPADHAGNGSVFVNEAAYSSGGFNNRHHKVTDPSTHNCLNSLLAHSSGRRLSGAKTAHLDMQSPHLYDSAEELRREDAHSDQRSYSGEAWSSQASGPESLSDLPQPGDPALDLSARVSMETDSGGEEGREEKIVYL